MFSSIAFVKLVVMPFTSANRVCASWGLRSRSQKTGSRAFLVDSFAKRGCIWTDIRQNDFNVISLKRGEFKLFYWWVEQWYSLYGAKVIEDFVVGMVLANSRFQYGAERRSKGNGTNEDFLVNLYELWTKAERIWKWFKRSFDRPPTSLALT